MSERKIVKTSEVMKSPWAIAIGVTVLILLSASLTLRAVNKWPDSGWFDGDMPGDIAEILAQKKAEARELDLLVSQIDAEFMFISDQISRLESVDNNQLKPELEELLKLLNDAKKKANDEVTTPDKHADQAEQTERDKMAEEGYNGSPGAQQARIDKARQTAWEAAQAERLAMQTAHYSLARQSVALHNVYFTSVRDISVKSALESSSLYVSWATKLKLVDRENGYKYGAGNQFAEFQSDLPTVCYNGFSYQPQYDLDACIDLLKAETNPLLLHTEVSKKQDLLKERKTRLALVQTALQTESLTIKAAQETLEKADTAFDRLVILGAPVLALCTLLIYFLGGREKVSKQHASVALPTITVLLLVSAIIILGLAGKLTPEVLGTLIGGISGYVLGQGLINLHPKKPGDGKVDKEGKGEEEEEEEEAEEIEGAGREQVLRDVTTQLTQKFGEIPGEHTARLQAATAEDLARYAKRIPTAASLADVFAEVPAVPPSV